MRRPLPLLAFLILALGCPTFAAADPILAPPALGSSPLFFGPLGPTRPGENPPARADIPNPTLHGRRSAAYDRAVGLIRQERFQEALAFLRRQPRDLRDWDGLRSLEAALVSQDSPPQALLLYDRILNSKERDMHWARALGGYRYLLRDLSGKGDYAARLRLIKCLASEWKNHEAREILAQTLLEEGLPDDIRKELESFGAVLSVRVGELALARSHFQGKEDRPSLRWLSTIALREGDFKEAARYRRAAADTLKGKQRLAELVKVLDILCKGGLTKDALALLVEVPELKDRVPAWSYYLGLSSLVEGKPEEALPFLEPETAREGERGQRALYFKGRALETLLRHPEAAVAYAKAANGAYGYYGLLAKGRESYLEGRAPGPGATSASMATLLLSPSGLDSDSMAFYLWLADRVPHPWPDIGADPPSAGPGDSGRARAAVFLHWAGGDRESAMDELRHAPQLLKPGRGSESEVKLLSLMAAYSGEPYLAVKLMQGLKGEGAFPLTMRWNHPPAYGSLILEAYRVYGIPPQLTLSVIRTESAFQRHAVSRSNARGLMQLLPSTAQRLATMLGDGQIREEELFEPSLNIRYGAHYLALLLGSFGEPALALASYNGGPYNVMTLLRAREGLPLDLFVETFPFSETANYVRTVLV
ncbi:MAG: lytic transglycosylase domain-containing protein, partial [Deltaproteobacteria bacterium]|nr:lytic transglycosylase domain-containing protein [Deltaproteobacteria bacterium]